MVFHLRLATWSAGCSQGGPSITFSIVSYSGILCPVSNASFPHLLMAKSEFYCLQLCNIHCVKYQIFSLNYSTSSTAFLLSYLFLRLIAIEQIFTMQEAEEIWLFMNINAFHWYTLQNVFYLRSQRGRKLTFIECWLCARNCTYLSQFRSLFILFLPLSSFA